MTPDAVIEASELIRAINGLRALLAVPKDKAGLGEISLIEDVSESGHGTRASVYLPEAVVRAAALRVQVVLTARLFKLGVDVEAGEPEGE